MSDDRPFVEASEAVEEGLDDRTNAPIPAIQGVSLKLPDDEHEIFRAVRFNDITMIDRHLRNGVNINIAHNGERCSVLDEALHRPILTKGYSLLHIAALHSSLETISSLLERGADVDAEESNKQTPLHFATASGRRGVVELLIHAGADVNKQTSSGKTALMVAVLSNHMSIVRLLITAGADLELTDIKGGTVLYMSTMFNGNDARFTEALIKAGSDVNRTNKQGAGPLMMAVQLHYWSVVLLLLRAGARLNQADQAGLTPLHPCVESNRNLDMALYLIQQGADANWKDRKGKSPLDKVIASGRLRMIQLLVTADARYTYEQMTSPRMEVLCGYWQPFQQWLANELSTPWSLQRCCRRVVRESLGPGRLDPRSVDSLRIPASLKLYLRFKTPDLDREYGLLRHSAPRPPVYSPRVPVGQVALAVQMQQLQHVDES